MERCEVSVSDIPEETSDPDNQKSKVRRGGTPYTHQGVEFLILEIALWLLTRNQLEKTKRHFLIASMHIHIVVVIPFFFLP